MLFLLISFLLIMTTKEPMLQKHWLENLSQNKNIKIKDILLPGTHNSHSYKMNPRKLYDDNKLFKIFSSLFIFDNFIQKWTLNQDYTIYEQLIMGVRWIDIDVTYDVNSREWKAIHSFENGNLDEMLEQIIQFMEETNEIILLVLTPRNLSNDYKRNLNKYVNKKFENYTIKKNLSDILNSKLSNLINSKKQLLLFSEGEETIYYRRLSQENWLNTNDPNDGFIKSKKLVLNMKKNDYKFNHISWILTGRTKNIILSFFNNGLKSLNNKFMQKFNIFYDNYHKELKENINIISFDFITNEIINKIIELNF